MAYSAPYSYPYPGQFRTVKDGEDYCKKLYAALQDRDSRQDYVRDRSTDADLKALIVRPEWYGAKGDGVTDDTTAIQAAITAATVGQTVWFSAKDYLFSSTLTVSKNITLRGGWALSATYTGTRLMKAASLSGIGIDISGQAATIDGIFLWGVEGNGGDGIAIRAGSVCLRNVEVYNQGGCGIRVGDDATANANIFYLDRVRCIENVSHGLYIHSPVPDANGGTVVNLLSNSNGGDGIRCGTCNYNTFIGTVTEANTGYGVNCVDGSVRQVFIGGDQWEANTAGNFNNAGSLNVFLGMADNPTDTGTFSTIIPAADQSSGYSKFNKIIVYDSAGGGNTLYIGASDATSRMGFAYNDSTQAGVINTYGTTGYTPLSITANPLNVSGATNITGDTQITGDLDVTGDITGSYSAAPFTISGNEPTITCLIINNTAASPSHTYRIVGGLTGGTNSHLTIYDATDAVTRFEITDVSGNIGFNTVSFGTNATKTIGVGSGTAPSTSPALDMFQMYSNDIVAGNAAPHFRTEAGDIVKLYKQVLAADLKEDYTTGDLDSEAEVIAAVNATNAKVNDLITALINTGLLAAA